MIKDLLTNKSQSERANIKGAEIAKLKSIERQNIKFGDVDLDIEVVSMKAIPNGVEVFIRAWDSEGQIGFGDGTIETERFIVINPPILVADGTSEKVIIQTVEGEREVVRKNYKEDLKEAILQSLAHSVKAIALKSPRGKIIKGKTGNTVSTFYPSLDGQVGGSDANWATVRGADSGDDGANYVNAVDGITAELVGGVYYVRRCFLLFDTSSLSTQSITGAILSIQADEKVTTQDQDADLVSSTPASTTELVAGDFDQIGSTVYGSLAFSSFQIDAYNVITLSAAGIVNINKSGVSKFAIRGSLDTDNSAPTNTSYLQFYLSETAGTTQDPKLVITHGGLDSRAENFRMYYTISKKEVSEVITN